MEVSTDYTWREHEVGPVVEDVAMTWIDTPYGDQRKSVRGVNANCLTLMAGMYDTLFRLEERTVMPRVSPDAGLHGSPTLKAVAELLKNVYGVVRVYDRIIEPGDAVVVNGEMIPDAPQNEAHVMVVLDRPWTAIHAVRRSKAKLTSPLACGPVVSVYRCERKGEWIR